MKEKEKDQLLQYRVVPHQGRGRNAAELYIYPGAHEASDSRTSGAKTSQICPEQARAMIVVEQAVDVQSFV